MSWEWYPKSVTSEAIELIFTSFLLQRDSDQGELDLPSLRSSSFAALSPHRS